MIYTGLGRVGEIADVKANGGADVAEVYGGINYQNPIFYSLKNFTGTSPLTFKALGQSLKDYHIFGETVQNGTPSPDYPVDVQGVGERTENLFDKDSPDLECREKFDKFGNIISNGTSAITGYIPIKPDTFYSMFPKNGASGWYGVFYDSEKNQISTFNVSGGGDGTGGQYIYKSPSNASYVRLTVLNLNAEYYARTMYVEGTEELVLSNIIPYGYKIPVTIGNVTTPIYIGSDPLYRIGEYADEIDFGNQRIIRRIKKVIINGTESMTVVGPYGGGKYKLRYRGIANSGICSGKEKDTHFRTTTKNMDGLLNGEMSFIGISSRYVDFCKDTTMRSLQNWRDYFAEQYSAGTPVIILYVLATPTTESVTIPTLTTITGDNALSIGTTIQPSAVSINGNIKPTGYGQLLDVNGVDIQDSTGEPIYIQG